MTDLYSQVSALFVLRVFVLPNTIDVYSVCGVTMTIWDVIGLLVPVY